MVVEDLRVKIRSLHLVNNGKRIVSGHLLIAISARGFLLRLKLHFGVYLAVSRSSLSTGIIIGKYGT